MMIPILSLLDPMTGRGPKILEKPVEFSGLFAAGDYAISPDGQHIAFVLPGRRNQIRIINLHGATEREITVSGAQDLESLYWSADGRSFLSGDEQLEIERLLHVQHDGASQVLWSQTASGFGIWGIPSPDGRYIATFQGKANANVWMVENP